VGLIIFDLERLVTGWTVGGGG